MDTDQKTIDLLVQRIVDVVDPLRMILLVQPPVEARIPTVISM